MRWGFPEVTTDIVLNIKNKYSYLDIMQSIDAMARRNFYLNDHDDFSSTQNLLIQLGPAPLKNVLY